MTIWLAYLTCSIHQRNSTDQHSSGNQKLNMLQNSFRSERERERKKRLEHSHFTSTPFVLIHKLCLQGMTPQEHLLCYGIYLHNVNFRLAANISIFPSPLPVQTCVPATDYSTSYWGYYYTTSLALVELILSNCIVSTHSTQLVDRSRWRWWCPLAPLTIYRQKLFLCIYAFVFPW